MFVLECFCSDLSEEYLTNLVKSACAGQATAVRCPPVSCSVRPDQCSPSLNTVDSNKLEYGPRA